MGEETSKNVLHDKEVKKNENSVFSESANMVTKMFMVTSKQ